MGYSPHAINISDFEEISIIISITRMIDIMSISSLTFFLQCNNPNNVHNLHKLHNLHIYSKTIIRLFTIIRVVSMAFRCHNRVSLYAYGKLGFGAITPITQRFIIKKRVHSDKMV
jgi:hypothetical protein